VVLLVLLILSFLLLLLVGITVLLFGLMLLVIVLYFSYSSWSRGSSPRSVAYQGSYPTPHHLTNQFTLILLSRLF